MSSRSAVRTGVQQPRVLALPQGAVSSAGSEAVELASVCGVTLDPWQQFVLEHALGERVDGSWAAAEAALIVARQNGKNGVLEPRELFGLVILGEWIIHTSHLFTTTKESYARLMALVEADPDVKNCLTYSVASPASGYEMRFRSGGRIRFIARSRTSGRGLTGDLLVIDEAQDLSDDALGALLPTISARPGSQTWYQGSAPGPTSVVWHRVRQRGRAGGDVRLAYFEFSADPQADLDDRDAWAQANPALGVRITEEAIEAERGAMSDEMFARERLSISPDIVEAGGVIPAEHWDKVCGDVHLGTDVKFGIDCNPERTKAAIAVADGTSVELVEHRSGLGWVIERVRQLHEKWGGVAAVDASGPAGSLIPDLEAAGVPVEQIHAGDFAKACGLFFDRVVEHTVAIRSHSALTQAAMGASTRPAGDAWRWDRRDETVDISPLCAATVALWVTAGVSKKKPVFAY